MNKEEQLDRKYLIELIHDLFRQGCYDDGLGKYSHDCISTYREAQAFLIAEGVIKKEECVFE